MCKTLSQMLKSSCIVEYVSSIKCPWFGDIKMELNRRVGARYVLRLIRHVLSTHSLSNCILYNKKTFNGDVSKEYNCYWFQYWNTIKAKKDDLLWGSTGQILLTNLATSPIGQIQWKYRQMHLKQSLLLTAYVIYLHLWSSTISNSIASRQNIADGIEAITWLKVTAYTARL